MQNNIPARVTQPVCARAGDAAELLQERFVAPLREAHGAEALVKFEELMEAAIDLDAVPEEYLIDAGYDEQLQARALLVETEPSVRLLACWVR
jgi:hypothetical protein